MASDNEPVVLFYTDNGIGLGHLTRQAAVASHARGAFRPYFLTMSASYTLLRKLGLPVEYFPSYANLRISKQRWEKLMTDRFLEAIRLTGACVVVVDHVAPPNIFESLRAHTEGVKFVWSRRGLWQAGKNRGMLERSHSFDLIVEPGDLASPLDQGATAGRRHEVVPTEPIVLTNRSQYLPRAEARDQLRIPRSGQALLIKLGGANPSEVARAMSHTAAVVDSVTDNNFHLFAPLHPLHSSQSAKVERVRTAPIYPVARYLNAFDGAVSTAGYNSFHEIIESGMPAVFIPQDNAQIDDQSRRAEFAALCGRGGWARGVRDTTFRAAIAKMLRPREREIAEKTTAALGEMRGASAFAEIIAELALTSGTPGHVLSKGAGDFDMFQKNEPAIATALDHDDAQLRELAVSLTESQIERTIVVVREGDPEPLHRNGITFESVMTESEWAALGRHGYARYISARISGIARRYRATRIMAPLPGEQIVESRPKEESE